MPKKLQNEELPHWIDAHWFQKIFVTTYMAFVGETINLWEVPIKQSVKVMQKIWNATSNLEYTITTELSVLKPG